MPVVVFVLWDDHIYDAWIKQADRLKFTSFDLRLELIEKLFESPTNEDQTEASTTENIEPKTPITPSSASTIPKTPDNNLDELASRLPSVPSSLSDTQQTQDMDVNDYTSSDIHRTNTYVTGTADLPVFFE